MEIKCHPTNRTAEILLYDDIGMGGIEASDVYSEVAAVGADSASIDVRINSHGGSIYAGTSIYNALVNSPAKITTYNDGLAGSIASVIMMAGSKRIAASNSMFMMHPAQWGQEGNHQEIRQVADDLEKLEPSLVEAYERSGSSKETVTELMWARGGRGSLLNAEEQSAHGFATEVSGGPSLCCPRIPESTYKLMPELVAWAKTLPPAVEPARLQEDIAKLRRNIDLTKIKHRL